MDDLTLNELTREQLMALCRDYAKNWLAMDGLWFQAAERRHGMDEAMEQDLKVWEAFTALEAQRIKALLDLPQRAGLDGLRRALKLRLYARLNRDEIRIQGNTLTYRVLDCRVQTARRRKGMEFHPCRAVGMVEYAGFARVIDDRFTLEAVSCYPQITDPDCACSWLFRLGDDKKEDTI